MKDTLGNRMKHNYEEVSKTRLLRRSPVIIRLDGKAFHTFTRGFKKPFDNILIRTMQDTMLYLCKNIQGCVLGYTQSDEITLLLIDYKKLGSEAWFDYEIQKMCSVSASMATFAFNRIFELMSDVHIDGCSEGISDEEQKYIQRLLDAVRKGALFDSRCFNVPVDEVTNAFLWRQLDAIRNSIQMVGQANFSSKELNKKTCEDIKEMLKDKNIIWDELPIHLQRGSCCIKNENGEWVIDSQIPIFKGNGRDYIETLLKKEE